MDMDWADTVTNTDRDVSMSLYLSTLVSLSVFMFMLDYAKLISTENCQDIYADMDMGRDLYMDMDTDTKRIRTWIQKRTSTWTQTWDAAWPRT
jgi:hypothetical protein